MKPLAELGVLVVTVSDCIEQAINIWRGTLDPRPTLPEAIAHVLAAAGYHVVQDFEGVIYGHSVKLAPPAEHHDGWRYCRIVEADDDVGEGLSETVRPSEERL